MLFADTVLILWIFVSIGLFAMLPPLRAFLLTYCIGYLVLPVDVYGMGSVAISATLHVDKITACHIGAMLGTLIFAPQVIGRYRFDVFDLAFGVVAAGATIASLSSGTGLKDGLVNAFTIVRTFGPLLVLTKMHVTSMDDVYVALRTYIASATVYTLVAVAEFRLSPQLHRLVYGYFQHDFVQFARYSWFRPVGMLRHALEMATFMGTACLAAGWLTWRKLFPPLWGWLPGWAATAALFVGLAVTMTYSGYGGFLLGVAALGLFLAAKQRPWVLLIIPIGATLWIAGRYTEVISGDWLIDVATYLDPTRADSLRYRLDADRIYLTVAHEHAAWGAGFSAGLITDEYGKLIKAVDAWWLITATFQGLVGLVGWLIVWTAGIAASLLMWRRLPARFRDVAAVISVMLGMQTVDFMFNSFPSYFLLMLSVSLVSLWHHVGQTAPRMASAMAPLVRAVPESSTPGGEPVIHGQT